MKERKCYATGTEIQLTNEETRENLLHQIQEDFQIPDGMQKVLPHLLLLCQSVTICKVCITGDSAVCDTQIASRYGEGVRRIRFSITPYKDIDDFCHLNRYGDIFCRKADYEILCQRYACDTLLGKSMSALLVADKFTDAFFALY